MTKEDVEDASGEGQLCHRQGVQSSSPHSSGVLHSCINLHHVSRQPVACIGARPQKDTFKNSLILFYLIPGAQTPNLSRTYVFLPALYTIVQ